MGCEDDNGTVGVVSESQTGVPNEPIGVLAASVAVLGFGAGNVLVKLSDLPGLVLVLWRMSGAALLYLVILYMRSGRISVDLIRRSLLTGLFFGANLAVGYLAVKRTTVANASIIGALQPLLVVSFVSRRFGEVIERWLWVIAPIAFAGTALVILGSSGSPSWSPLGDALAVGSMILWAGYFAAAKKARATTDVFELQAASLLCAAVFLAPLSIVGGVLTNLPSGRDGMVIAALILVPGTGHALMNWAHAHIEISLASILTLAVPVLSTIGAALFLDESIVLAQVAGMTVVLAALAYTVKRSVDGAALASELPRRRSTDASSAGLLRRR